MTSAVRPPRTMEIAADSAAEIPRRVSLLPTTPNKKQASNSLEPPNRVTRAWARDRSSREGDKDGKRAEAPAPELDTRVGDSERSDEESELDER
jgi:hypothetical protein